VLLLIRTPRASGLTPEAYGPFARELRGDFYLDARAGFRKNAAEPAPGSLLGRPVAGGATIAAPAHDLQSGVVEAGGRPACARLALLRQATARWGWR